MVFWCLRGYKKVTLEINGLNEVIFFFLSFIPRWNFNPAILCTDIFHYIIHSSQLFSSENLLGKSPNQIQISPGFFIKRPLGFTLKAYFKKKETRCLKDLKEMYAMYFTVLSFSCVKYICCLLAQLYHI